MIIYILFTNKVRFYYLVTIMKVAKLVYDGRELAQQPPCVSVIGKARIGVVADRYHLVPNSTI